MVGLEQIKASNAGISTTYPEGLVAVFAGATSGIGETSLREFTRHTVKPRIYVIGRSKEACDRLDAELKELNPSGTYSFLRTDTSLLRNVDDVCAQIKERETAVNVLFMSQGTANWYKVTDEGLNYLAGVCYFGRIRMIANLLPLMQQAAGLRRVVSSWTAGNEGPVYDDNWVVGNTKIKVPLTAARGHGTSMMTMALQHLAKTAPTVSFIHNFPGAVRTNLIRSDDGLETPVLECGERHAFYCTSAKYPPGRGEGALGVALPEGVGVARGIDGQDGTGVYSLTEEGESADLKVDELLAKYARDGTAEKLWTYTQGEFTRVRGNSSI
ncbi:hypothetical protein M406DRAFT_38016 [Cryphonectria parasitica EP155]|uniref:Uncharacterized protein n=1 Tax=Cryphonectria parasitica (strain ATCC 38755 / EP155) TaxID=660469 RepID=A0A9P4Y457_CRYP1|nr:uncharacterized protein M406DRAFT_38016 [Cryphonectria parasitica EP155]KAF3766614.1 hypothetical protein M406DRAFT_38016 [Cryphonectria parasitica EP155]